MLYKVRAGTVLVLTNLERGEGTLPLDRTELASANRQIGIQLELQANRVIARRDLTGAQGRMLLYILEHSEAGTSLTQIHDAFGYSKAALSAILKRLREKGYVRVEPCARDDRRKLLFVTEKGRQVKASLDQAFSTACDQLYHGFSESELAQLDRMQRKMLCNLSQAGEAPRDILINKEAETQ